MEEEVFSLSLAYLEKLLTLTSHPKALFQLGSVIVKRCYGTGNSHVLTARGREIDQNNTSKPFVKQKSKIICSRPTFPGDKDLEVFFQINETEWIRQTSQPIAADKTPNQREKRFPNEAPTTLCKGKSKLSPETSVPGCSLAGTLESLFWRLCFFCKKKR